MIIDYRSDPSRADQHEILDAATGMPLPMTGDFEQVFYADDQAGIMLHYRKDDQGRFLVAFNDDPSKPLKKGDVIFKPLVPAWFVIRMPIKIVRKGELWSPSKLEISPE